MTVKTRVELRSEVFKLMHRDHRLRPFGVDTESSKTCAETHSQGRMLENVTHTKRLMAALNAFYLVDSENHECITMKNASSNEIQGIKNFIANKGKLPIDLDVCFSLKDELLREFAYGYAALRTIVLPNFEDITNMDSSMSARHRTKLDALVTNGVTLSDMGNMDKFVKTLRPLDLQFGETVFNAMKACSDSKVCKKLLQEVYGSTEPIQSTVRLVLGVIHDVSMSLQKAEEDEKTRIRAETRQEVFEAMRMCSATVERQNVIQTKRLLVALSRFYNPYPDEKELITMENATTYELQIAATFLNRTRFPLSFSSISNMSSYFGTQHHEFGLLASGLAALRIEFMPQFVSIMNRDFDLQALTYENGVTYEDNMSYLKCMSHHSGGDMDHRCVYCPCGLDVLKEMTKKPREVLRRAVFDAMSSREDISVVDRLMEALVEFYHPSPSKDEHITLDNSSTEEIEIATNFFVEIFELNKCNLPSESPDYMRSLRINASGLVYLRVELLPHFIKQRNLRNRLYDILFYEDMMKTLLSEAYAAMSDEDKQNYEAKTAGEFPPGHGWWSTSFVHVRFQFDPMQEYFLND